MLFKNSSFKFSKVGKLYLNLQSQMNFLTITIVKSRIAFLLVQSKSKPWKIFLGLISLMFPSLNSQLKNCETVFSVCTHSANKCKIVSSLSSGSRTSWQKVQDLEWFRTKWATLLLVPSKLL